MLQRHASRAPRTAASHRRPTDRGRRSARHSRAATPRPPLPARSPITSGRPFAFPGGSALALSRALVLPLNPQGAAQLLTKGLAALIVLGVAGLIGFFIVADERRGVPAEASTTPAGSGLDDRTADPKPLTLEEVFPDPARVRPPGPVPAYPITMTHIDSDCRIATFGTLGRLLTDHGCSQVVRASVGAPYGDYQVTTGLFNLSDAAGASSVGDQLRRLVETGDGNFAAMSTGEPGTDPTPPPASQVGWHARGHYLLYCVITRPGGAVVPNDDPNAARITADLVDGYLDAGVLGRRGTR